MMEKRLARRTRLTCVAKSVFNLFLVAGCLTALPASTQTPQAGTADVQATAPLQATAQTRHITIVLVGDSTVATGGGWGPGFCASLTTNVTCIDVAANGRSTKSFLDEGLWQKALAEKGQFYLVQFGHNDQKDDPKRHTDPNTTYAANLRRYTRDVRALGAVPILVTPLSRRNYRDGHLEVDPLQQYAAAVRQVGREEGVAVVDLYALSTSLLRGMSQAEADTLDAQTHPDAVAENGGAAKPDRTHLNAKGKALFGRMVADEVLRVEPALRPDVQSTPAATTPK